MTYLVAVTGKGGTGKTTVSAFLVRLLLEKGLRPVLAVDADPNSSLAPLLGLRPGPTIGDIREEVLKEKEKMSGVPKRTILEMKFEECILETQGFDLLTMGRSEGPGCYCYVNSLLRGALSTLKSNYRAVVVDNEAGMEHLSRMNASNIHCLVTVCEPSMASARAADRILDLSKSLSIAVRRRVMVWNKVRPSAGVPEAVRGLLAGNAFDDTVVLPADEQVEQLCAMEQSVFDVPMPQEFTGLLDACVLESKAQSADVKG